MLVKRKAILRTNSSALNPAEARLSVITDMNDVQFHIVKDRLCNVNMTPIMAISESLIHSGARKISLPCPLLSLLI